MFLTLDYITCASLSTTLDFGYDPVHPQRGPHRRPSRGRNLGAGSAEQRQHLSAPLRGYAQTGRGHGGRPLQALAQATDRSVGTAKAATPWVPQAGTWGG